MQIIKLGDCHAAPIYKFHCPECNCIYLAAEWELHYSAKDANPELLYRQCPGCGNKIAAYDAKIVTSINTLTETISENEFNIAERAERVKLKEAVTFIQTYCTTHPNCKGCPFDGGVAEKCELVQLPCDWDTDF